MSKNIKISFDLLSSAISLLNCIDVEDYDHDFAQLFGYVSHSLNIKKSTRYPARNDDDDLPFTSCNQCDGITF